MLRTHVHAPDCKQEQLIMIYSDYCYLFACILPLALLLLLLLLLALQTLLLLAAIAVLAFVLLLHLF